MAIVQTGSLLSFSIASLVQLTRMGSLAGFLYNSKSLLVGLSRLCSPKAKKVLPKMPKMCLKSAL